MSPRIVLDAHQPAEARRGRAVGEVDVGLGWIVDRDEPIAVVREPHLGARRAMVRLDECDPVPHQIEPILEEARVRVVHRRAEPFFFSSRRRHTRFDCDWSSDVCSSDLALSDATRRGVLEQLGRADASITDLADKFHMTLTGMKKHVGVLEQAGLVTTEKVGRVRTCKLGLRRLDEEAAWIERYLQLWDARFDELHKVVEELKWKEKVDGRQKRE